jgi:hypothetical protein
VSSRLARLALGLYPLAYRRRYGAEMEGLVADTGSSPRVVADLLRGALAAHLRPSPAVAGELEPGERIRLGAGTVLLCWVFFAAAGLGLYKTTEGGGFSRTSDAHRLLGDAHLAIQVLAVVAAAVALLGAAPLVLAALRQWRQRPAVRRAALLAAACALVFAAASAGLVAAANASPAVSPGLGAAVFAAWALVGLACGLGIVAAARRGLAALELRPGTLRETLLAADGLVLAMAAIALATAVYLASLLATAPGLAGQANGPLGLLSAGASLALQLAVMVLATGGAALSAGRARRTG